MVWGVGMRAKTSNEMGSFDCRVTSMWGCQRWRFSCECKSVNFQIIHLFERWMFLIKYSRRMSIRHRNWFITNPSKAPHRVTQHPHDPYLYPSRNYMFSHWFKMYGAFRAVIFHNRAGHVQHFWNWRVEFPHEIDVSRYALHLALYLSCLAPTYIVCLNLSRAANWRNCYLRKRREIEITVLSVIMRESFP